MKWLRDLGKPKVAPVPDLLDMYQLRYTARKMLLVDALDDVVREYYPELCAEEADGVAALASNLMTAEPANPRASKNLDPRLRLVAAKIAKELLTNSAELRAASSEASQALALLFLGMAVNTQDLSIDENRLEQAERCIANAIQWGQETASYYATAAQINMSWGRFYRAYLAASNGVVCDPNNAETVRMKGMAAYACGELDEALLLLEHARALNPDLEDLEGPLRMLRMDLAGSV